MGHVTIDFVEDSPSDVCVTRPLCDGPSRAAAKPGDRMPTSGGHRLPGEEGRLRVYQSEVAQWPWR